LELKPETTALAIKSTSFSGDAEVLTRESTTHNINCSSLIHHAPHIGVQRRIREMTLQHCLGMAVNLAHADNFHTSPLKAKVKATNTAEQT
jgi:hypothetical protein